MSFLSNCYHVQHKLSIPNRLRRRGPANALPVVHRRFPQPVHEIQEVYDEMYDAIHPPQPDDGDDDDQMLDVDDDDDDDEIVDQRNGWDTVAGILWICFVVFFGHPYFGRDTSSVVNPPKPSSEVSSVVSPLQPSSQVSSAVCPLQPSSQVSSVVCPLQQLGL
ncbi:hypothetical protein MKW92_045945 [Papaver armeniacum]|nr:hypothetical protein MKW92_045945 [Papaver armeniacum]